MPFGFYIIMAAQFFSSLADNALLVAAIAALALLDSPAWLTPMLKLFFTISYVVLAPFVGAFADAPSVAGFGKRMNPHSGYFAPGDEPRRLIARLLARPLGPPGPGQQPGLVRMKGRIRTSAVALEV